MDRPVSMADAHATKGSLSQFLGRPAACPFGRSTGGPCVGQILQACLKHTAIITTVVQNTTFINTRTLPSVQSECRSRRTKTLECLAHDQLQRQAVGLVATIAYERDHKHASMFIDEAGSTQRESRKARFKDNKGREGSRAATVT